VAKTQVSRSWFNVYLIACSTSYTICRGGTGGTHIMRCIKFNPGFGSCAASKRYSPPNQPGGLAKQLKRRSMILDQSPSLWALLWCVVKTVSMQQTKQTLNETPSAVNAFQSSASYLNPSEQFSCQNRLGKASYGFRVSLSPTQVDPSAFFKVEINLTFVIYTRTYLLPSPLLLSFCSISPSVETICQDV
jgi:hypothetical protein